MSKVHKNTNEIVCPHCGYTFSDSWEFESYDPDIECPDCEGHFECSRDTWVTYSTTPIHPTNASQDQDK